MEYINILTAIVIVLLGAILYLKNVCYTYWKRRGLPYIEPEFYYGNIRRSIKGEITPGEDVRDSYREFRRRGQRHGGIYMFFSPVYIPTDPELIKCILQKDFDHFVNRGMYVNEKVDPLTGHLFSLEDSKWRNLRTKLTPTFTSGKTTASSRYAINHSHQLKVHYYQGKMKMMFQTIVECSNEMEKILDNHSVLQDAVDIKEVLARFTTDVIGSCAFGLDCNSLKNPDSEFRRVGRKLMTPTRTGIIKRLIRMIFPISLLKKLRYKMIRKDIEAFFMKMVKDTVEYREQNNVVRKDFMHLLLELKNKGKVTDDDTIGDVKVTGDKKPQNFLTLNEITAQCFVFFIAGFETSSTTMTFVLYEMAMNQDIQDKVREEIRTTLKKHNNALTYECIMEMTYLDKVINETLRLHSPSMQIQRICNKAYHVPDTDIVIEPGVTVAIPTYGLHTDPEYYPNPEIFDPERFSEENKAKRPSATFMPFGEGPRICIGLRFGLLQSKVGLVRTLENYRVTLNGKTKTPIKFNPRSLVATVQGGVWLNVAKVDENIASY